MEMNVQIRTEWGGEKILCVFRVGQVLWSPVSCLLRSDSMLGKGKALCSQKCLKKRCGFRAWKTERSRSDIILCCPIRDKHEKWPFAIEKNSIIMAASTCIFPFFPLHWWHFVPFIVIVVVVIDLGSIIRVALTILWRRCTKSGGEWLWSSPILLGALPLLK